MDLADTMCDSLSGIKRHLNPGSLFERTSTGSSKRNYFSRDLPAFLAHFVFALTKEAPKSCAEYESILSSGSNAAGKKAEWHRPETWCETALFNQSGVSLHKLPQVYADFYESLTGERLAERLQKVAAEKQNNTSHR
jgi:hypothetical protein